MRLWLYWLALSVGVGLVATAFGAGLPSAAEFGFGLGTVLVVFMEIG